MLLDSRQFKRDVLSYMNRNICHRATLKPGPDNDLSISEMIDLNSVTFTPPPPNISFEVGSVSPLERGREQSRQYVINCMTGGLVMRLHRWQIMPTDNAFLQATPEHCEARVADGLSASQQDDI